MPYIALLHSHVSSWIIGIILFVLALVFLKSGKMKGLKITQMILRVFYIIIFLTGVALLLEINFAAYATVKALLAFGLIYVMEMILVRGSKGTLDAGKAKSFGASFLVLLVAVLYLGYGKPF